MAEGIHVRQIMSAHVTSNVYRFRVRASAKQLKPYAYVAELLLKMHLQRFDCGILFCCYYDIYLYNAL